MALYTKPSLEQALAIVEDIVAQRKRWGSQAGAAQYSLEQLTQAIIVIHEASNVDGPSKADLTKANRQVAASGAREAALKKSLAEVTQEVDHLSAEVVRLEGLLAGTAKTELSSDEAGR